jgi:hypothetical protein
MDSIDQNTNGNNNRQTGRDDNSVTNIIIPPDYIQNKLPSDISYVLLHLSKLLDSNVQISKSKTNPYGIEDKIQHNNLIKYRQLVEEYGSYGKIADKAYEDLNFENPNKSNHFISSIKFYYNDVLGNLLKNNPKVEKITVIKNNSDEIMDSIKERMFNNYINSSNTRSDITIERVDMCIVIIICKAFIDCKILEEPPK